MIILHKEDDWKNLTIKDNCFVIIYLDRIPSYDVAVVNNYDYYLPEYPEGGEIFLEDVTLGQYLGDWENSEIDYIIKFDNETEFNKYMLTYKLKR